MTTHVPHHDHRTLMERSWRSLNESLVVLRASYASRGSFVFFDDKASLLPVFHWDENLIAQCERVLGPAYAVLTPKPTEAVR